MDFIEPGERLDARTIIRQAIDNGKAEQTITLNDVLTLKDLSVRENDGIAVFLFERSDPGGLTQMYKHRVTKEVRPSDRTDEENIAVSAHMFVDLKRKLGYKYPTYDAILEEREGISKSYVQSILNMILSRQVYSSKDKRGNKIETTCRVDLRGHPSETMENALENSYVRNVMLVKPGKLEGFDSEHVVIKDDVLKLRLRAEPTNTIPILDRIWSLAKRVGWSEFRVQVEMPENKSRIVSVEREASAADALFVRAFPVNVKNKIPSCCKTIHEELVTRAKEAFAEAGS